MRMRACSVCVQRARLRPACTPLHNVCSVAIAWLNTELGRALAQVATRHNNTIQMGLFVTIMASIYMAERLNALAADNWESFSTQNYFDQRGVFISTLWSTPLLLIGVVMLFQSLYQASSLLVQVQ